MRQIKVGKTFEYQVTDLFPDENQELIKRDEKDNENEKEI